LSDPHRPCAIAGSRWSLSAPSHTSKGFLRYSFSIARAANMQKRRCKNAGRILTANKDLVVRCENRHNFSRCAKTFHADQIRKTPSANLIMLAGARPTSRPPTSAGERRRSQSIGPRSRATLTTARWRSATTLPNAQFVRSPSAGRIICSQAPTSAPPRCRGSDHHPTRAARGRA